MIQNPQMIPAWIDGVLAPLDKLEVHLRGIKHRAVSVFVMAGDQILLQRRALGNTTHRAFGRIPAAPIPYGTRRHATAPRGGLLRSWGSLALIPSGSRRSNIVPMWAAA